MPAHTHNIPPKQVLYGELGFTGNTKDYYNPDNSYINRVLETKKGVCLCVSVTCVCVCVCVCCVCVRVGWGGGAVCVLMCMGGGMCVVSVSL